MHEPPDELIGVEVYGYRITRKVGSGGMGAVYEASHSTIGQRVAIKVLFPEFSQSEDDVRRFVDEARAASKVEHPGLVRIYNHGRLSTNTAFIMMEFLSGESLRKYIERTHAEGRTIAPAEALSIAHEVAETLVSVHRLDIVHRDIKPDNLILCPQEQSQRFNRVKIVDFGIAKFNNMNSSGGVKSTTVGRFLGTALYASPEQCQMAGAVTTKADVYSLGVVLYEMLAGRPPFLAEQPGMVIGMHLFQPPPPLEKYVSGVQESIEQLVSDMLIKDPHHRPTMEQVLRRIISIETGVSPGKISRKRRRQLVFAATSSFLVVLVSGLYIYSRQTKAQKSLLSTRSEIALPSQKSELSSDKNATANTKEPILKPEIEARESDKQKPDTHTPASSDQKSKKKITINQKTVKKLSPNGQTTEDLTPKQSTEQIPSGKIVAPPPQSPAKVEAAVPAEKTTKVKRSDPEDAFY